MPYRPIRLDDSFVRTEPGRPRVAPGYYRAAVDAMRPTAENYDGASGYYVDFRIAAGPDANPGAGVGRVIPRYCSMGGKEGSQFNIAGIMGAVGLADVQKALFERYKGQDLPYNVFVQICKFLEGKARGKFVVLTIADETSPQGRAFSSVIEVQADSQWDSLKGTPLVGVAPTAPNGAAAAPAVSMAEAVEGMFKDMPDA